MEEVLARVVDLLESFEIVIEAFAHRQSKAPARVEPARADSSWLELSSARLELARAGSWLELSSARLELARLGSSWLVGSSGSSWLEPRLGSARATYLSPRAGSSQRGTVHGTE